MYARLVLFTLAEADPQFTNGMIREFGAGLRQVPGFVDVTFFADYATNEYGSLAIWANKEAAENAFAGFNAKLVGALEGRLVGELRHPLFEVLEAGA